MLRVMMTLLLTCSVASSNAQALPCQNENPLIVTQGQTSPCEGVLMSKADTLRLADESIRLKQALIDLEKAAKKLVTAKKLRRLDQKQCDEQGEACDVQVAALTQRLTTRTVIVETVPWTQRPWFVATLTILVTAAIAVPATWMAVTEAK